MKKIILSIVLALATTVCTAQSVNDVISQFKGVKGVTCLNLDKTMIKLMGQGKGNMRLPEKMQLGAVVNSIDSVKILTLEDCNASIKKKFANKNINWDKYGYESVLTSKEDGENVEIFGKKDGDVFKEIVIRVVSGDDDNVLLQVFGKIDPKMLNNNK